MFFQYIVTGICHVLWAAVDTWGEPVDGTNTDPALLELTFRGWGAGDSKLISKETAVTLQVGTARMTALRWNRVDVFEKRRSWRRG